MLALLSLSSGAFANDLDDPRQAREHFEKGTRLYELGHFDEAIKEYETAYQLKNDPALLYNVAQAHRLAGHLQQALFNYRSYLHKLPNAPNREEVEGRIVELQKRIEQGSPSPSKPEAQPAPEPAPAPVSAPAVAAPVEPQPIVSEPVAVSRPPDRPPSSPRTLKITGLTLIGIGALGLVGGVTSTALAVTSSHAVTQEATQHQPFDPSKQREGTATQIAADVLYAVGSAAIVTGAVLTYLGYRKPRRQTASFSPAVGPRFAGLAWVGSFE